uniref:Phosphoinositide 3-kinase regulatory subunit 5 n=1 Tax=Sinocyclocheilus anshuiensis TaxID=1608454 RepID=A0A671SGN3_9TELE
FQSGHTSCTEDRIQHALERCLDGLRPSENLTQSWNAGWCMNRWSLEELVKRDPENFLILLQQILRKAREVQQECHYELVAPLALMFESTLLQMPLCPSDGEILTEACEVFHDFLAWPEPYCSVCRNLLSTLHQELRAPGISYHRLVREEQGLATSSQSRRKSGCVSYCSALFGCSLHHSLPVSVLRYSEFVLLQDYFSV